jgi:anaerobic nitric oxide reductase transcription regulator
LEAKSLGPLNQKADNLDVQTIELYPLINTEFDLKVAINDFQKHCILMAVTQADGNWSEAARALKTDRANLVRMAKRLGISVKKSVINN